MHIIPLSSMNSETPSADPAIRNNPKRSPETITLSIVSSRCHRIISQLKKKSPSKQIKNHNVIKKKTLPNKFPIRTFESSHPKLRSLYEDGSKTAPLARLSFVRYVRIGILRSTSGRRSCFAGTSRLVRVPQSPTPMAAWFDCARFATLSALSSRG